MKKVTVGLFFMEDRPRSVELARRIASNAYGGYDVRFALGCEGELCGDPEVLGLPLEKIGRLDDAGIALSIGGDGTFLRAARAVRGTRARLYGINAGRLGFLAAGHADAAESDLSRILSGDYALMPRIPLKGSVLWRDGHRADMIALNEIVVAKEPSARPAELCVSVGEDRLFNFLADGLIISTPTGSTAYALSAGGPIVHPDVRCVLIVPMCPHSLFSRPVVVGEGASVTVRAAGNVAIYADGHQYAQMSKGDRIAASLDVDNCIDIITLNGDSYYEVLRDKLGWGHNGLASWDPPA